MAEAIAVPIGPWTRDVEIGEDERLCPTCSGATIRKVVQGDAALIEFCRECRDGKQTLCEYCHAFLAFPRSSHPCPERNAAWKAEADRKEAEHFAAAEHLTVDQAKAAGIQYVIWPDSDGEPVTDVDDMDWKADDREDQTGERPTYAWATVGYRIALEADGIVENACSDLHEEAYDNIAAEAIEELQAFLTAWCEKHGDGTTTYEPDYKRAVLVPAKEAPADA